jgi:DNA-binding CsgD family transcriptional regulator
LHLVERDEALESIQNLFAKDSRGRNSVVLVSGPVACGKTALLSSAAQRAADNGWQILCMAGSPAERDLRLGVLTQLLTVLALRTEQLDLDDSVTNNIKALHEEMALLRDRTDDEPKEIPFYLMQRLGVTFKSITEAAPLAISIDDTQFVDPESLRALIRLSQQQYPERLVIMLTASPYPKPAYGWYKADLIRHPNYHIIQLRTLTPAGVEELLAAHPQVPRTPDFVTQLHELSGGNPLLIRAILADTQETIQSMADAPETVWNPVQGAAYRNAVLNCLYRSGPASILLGQAIAILDDHSTPALSSRLVDMSADHAAEIIEALSLAGLLPYGGLWSPSARYAILQDLPAVKRADLHLRAARLLHREGAESVGIARHLLAADPVAEEWAVSALEEAARDLSHEDSVALAAEFLDRAVQTCTDDQHRAEIEVERAIAILRIDPTSATRSLPSLIQHIRNVNLSATNTHNLMQIMMWHGRPDEVLATVQNLTTAAENAHSPNGLSEEDARIFRLRVICLYPGLRSRLDRVEKAPDLTAQTAAPIDPRLQAISALAMFLDNGPGEDAAAIAFRVLQSTRLDDSTIEALTSALLVMLFTERIGEAQSCCRRLLTEATQRHAPTWQAVFAIAQAQIDVWLGNLRQAYTHADKALTFLPLHSWGTYSSAPLAPLVTATTEMGMFEEAATHLGRSFASSSLETLYGMDYLYARGQHHLATGQPFAALNDFLTCGQYLRSWAVDRPGLVPWRTGVAESLLATGDHAEAQSMIEEQLTFVGKTPSRARGQALRLAAAVAAPRERPAILNEAISLVQASGDRLEMARGLAALSRAYTDLGEFRRARTVESRALDLARQCEAATLCDAIQRGTVSPAAGETVPPHSVAYSDLTDAERRVAMLAAQGSTNREIATALEITPSTVEQHLTHIYRKLGVRRRGDLPAGPY